MQQVLHREKGRGYGRACRGGQIRWGMHICTCTHAHAGVRLAGRGQRMDSRSSHQRIYSVQLCVLSKHTATHSQRSSQSGWAVWRHTAWVSHRPCTCGGCCRARILGSFTWPASRASRPGRSSSQGRATVWSVPRGALAPAPCVISTLSGPDKRETVYPPFSWCLRFAGLKRRPGTLEPARTRARTRLSNLPAQCARTTHARTHARTSVV